MSAHSNIDTLREIVKRDQEFFKIQSKRLQEIQQCRPDQISSADRNALQNWDKSVVKDCNRQLLLLEEIEQPTVEEREIMQELNKLIVLGDHIMEMRNLVQAELHAKLAVLEAAKDTVEAPAEESGSAHAGTTPVLSTDYDIPGDSHAMSAPGAESSKDSTPPSAAQEIQSPTPGEDNDNGTDHATEPLKADTVNNDIDPKMLYAIIKAKPDAPLSEVKKAAKKAITLLHPDRNLGDPMAASRFADLQAACEVFETEDTRREFDDTGNVKQIEDLDRRLRALVIEK